MGSDWQFPIITIIIIEFIQRGKQRRAIHTLRTHALSGGVIGFLSNLVIFLLIATKFLIMHDI